MSAIFSTFRNADRPSCTRRVLVAAGLLLFASTPSFAQLSSLRCKSLPAGQKAMLLDSLSVDPVSIHFADGIAYEYDLSSGWIYFQEGLAAGTEVCYRVLPFALHSPVYLYDLSLYHAHGLPANYDSMSSRPSAPALKREELFPTGRLSKAGSISRGVTFGNTNSLGVNSALNLQLDGQLTDKLNVNAVITDQQVPFQPEGNTQYIQDFDRVLIDLYSENFSVKAGDVILQNDSSYFLRYYKNTMGGQAAVTYNLPGRWRATTRLSASQAKGKFASVLLEAQEGLLGPYRLRGPDGERFVVVLANSEKVYLDGRLLKRGFDGDYVIDYNLAELTFNPRILITKFSRIRVDYEYAAQNFARSVVSASHRQQTEKTNLYFESYREKDNPHRPLMHLLSEDEKLDLAAIGDDLSKAVISGADSVAFTANQVLYSRVDTTDLQGNTYTIYKHSTDPEKAMYQVSFSQVSAGNYRQKPLGVNGKVYEWVAPVNGVPQGSYEPLVPIVTPNSRQLAVGGFSSRLSSYERIFTEFAASKYDRNLYSSLDSHDDHGWSQRSGVQSEGRPVGFLTNYKWSSQVSYEYDQRYFKPIDRFRKVEYDRDWSFPEGTLSGETAEAFDDHIVEGNVGMTKDNLNRWNYQAGYRKRGVAIDGWQHKALLRQQISRFSVAANYFQLKSSRLADESDWRRADITGAYQLGKLMPGYTFRSDENRIYRPETDSVVASAINFREHLLFLQSVASDSTGNSFRLDASRRTDKRPVEGKLVESDDAFTANGSFTSRWKENHAVSGTITYRRLSNLLDHTAEKDETLQGRVDWQSGWLNQAIRSNFSLALLNSRELRKEYIFIEVLPVQGTHAWRDDNEDGVQDLNEFYEAINPDERNYAKIFVPTDEYLLAYQTIFNYSLDLGAPTSWRNQGGLRKFLSRVSSVSAAYADKKTQETGWTDRINVLDRAEGDLASMSGLRSRWFFNRTNPDFGFDAGYTSNTSRQLLTGGWEAKHRESWQLNTRNNISADWTLFVRGELGSSGSSSDLFHNRNFEIRKKQLRPQLQWMPYQWLRITGGFRYALSAAPVPELPGQAFSAAREYQLEWQLSKNVNATFSGFLKMIGMAFEGDEASPLGYELLEALRPGTNYTWRLQWQQRLRNGLRMQLNYDGRKSPEKAMVHFGGVQVTALF